jgi:hypothetical protein
MRALRARRRAKGLREIRLLVPDVKSEAFRRELARQVASLDPQDEAEVMRWIEDVGEFYEDDAPKERHLAQGMRELRIVIPDARSPEFRKRVAEEVARLNPAAEEEAIAWIESVSLFDNEDAPR